MKPTDIRRIVAEAVKHQCSIEIAPDGVVKITPPPKVALTKDELSLIDFRK